MARIKKPAQTKVESIRHKDKRANIPTEELRDFVADEELAPKTMLYSRDPSLDPQLVWKGKDEQDREDLAVCGFAFDPHVAEEPYDKLKRAIRAEIDEAAWSSLYGTVSRPFAKPETGKIAVKVINHYGDEVLKVFEI